MQNLVVGSDAFTSPVTVNKGAFELTTATGLTGDMPGKRISFDPTNLTWGNSRLMFNGDMVLSEKDILLDSTLSADGIEWTRINHLLDYFKKESPNADQPPRDGHVLVSILNEPLIQAIPPDSE